MIEKSAYLLLGTNMGDTKMNLNTCIQKIQSSIGEIVKKSSIYQTMPWGNTDQPDYLNQAVEVKTILDPISLLKAINDVEQQMGRTRFKKWAPRLIDIDILLFGDLVLQTQTLTIPHHYLHERRFALQPLAEIAPKLIHPLKNKAIHELLESCEDSLSVTKI